MTAVVTEDPREVPERRQAEQLKHAGSTAAELTAPAQQRAALPVLDERSESEILGYGTNGIPT